MRQWRTAIKSIDDVERQLQLLDLALRVVLRDNADVLSPSIGYGPVIRSPNGKYWRITVDNAGALSTVDVTSTYS